MKKFALAFVALAALSTAALAERSSELQSVNDYKGLDIVAVGKAMAKSTIVIGSNVVLDDQVRLDEKNGERG